MTVGAGELFYYDGSHRFRRILYGRQYKSVSEAEKCGATGAFQAEVRGHVESLGRQAHDLELRKSVFAAKRADVLIWHADLAHGGNPISTRATCKSVVTHYCPKRQSPLFAERVAAWLGEHEGHYTRRYKNLPAPGPDPENPKSPLAKKV